MILTFQPFEFQDFFRYLKASVCSELNEWANEWVQRFRENSSSVINLRANDEITFPGVTACNVLKSISSLNFDEAS